MTQILLVGGTFARSMQFTVTLIGCINDIFGDKFYFIILGHYFLIVALNLRRMEYNYPCVKVSNPSAMFVCGFLCKKKKRIH